MAPLSPALEQLRQQLEELVAEADVIASAIGGRPSTHRPGANPAGGPAFLNWQVRCESAIKRIAGADSSYAKAFIRALHHASGSEEVRCAAGAVAGLMKDLSDGHLNDLPLRVRAEVFADFLSQAEYLLNDGWHLPAAVLLGAVLEDALRKLCARHTVKVSAKATLEPMNQELVKAGIYNLTVGKQVTAWAHIRNKAAHGEPKEFTADQVRLMVQGVTNFVALHL